MLLSARALWELLHAKIESLKTGNDRSDCSSYVADCIYTGTPLLDSP